MMIVISSLKKIKKRNKEDICPPKIRSLKFLSFTYFLKVSFKSSKLSKVDLLHRKVKFLK